jgi:hypothetical protein
VHPLLIDGGDAAGDAEAMELADLRSGLDGVDEHRLIAALEKRYRVEAGGAGVEGADVRW